MQYRLTILQVLPKMTMGGVERGTTEIANYLVENGHIAIVVAEDGAMRSRFNSCVKFIELPLATKNIFKILLNSFRLAKIIKKEKVDIVHARSRAPAISAYLACKGTGCKFITSFHGLYSSGNSLKKYYNSIMTRGEGIIAVSDFIKNHIISEYGIDPKKITTIHRGADIKYFDITKISTTRIVDFMTKYSIPDDLPVIFMPGRMTQWKGQIFLIEALAAIDHRNFFCYMAGADDSHSAYQQTVYRMIEKHNLKMKFIGAVSDMTLAYAAADLVVSASVKPEAFGRVAIEAGSMGKPVIATNIGGSLETIINHPIDKRTGWLVSHKHPKEMTDAIIEAISMSNDSLRQIGKNARDHVAAHFTSEKMCTKTIELYHQYRS